MWNNLSQESKMLVFKPIAALALHLTHTRIPIDCRWPPEIDAMKDALDNAWQGLQYFRNHDASWAKHFNEIKFLLDMISHYVEDCFSDPDPD